MPNAIVFPNLRPEIFSIDLFGMEFALRWYALAYIAALLIGWRLVVALMKRPKLWGGQAPMTPPQVEELLTAIILGVIIGGRLGFVLFYQPAYYLAHPGEILKIWQGGMAFHGGFAGVAVAGVWFCRKHGLRALAVADALALVAPIGLFLGRLANFINAELWGRPTSVPWGVIFPGAAAQDCPGVIGPCARHPTQLYEAGLEGLVLGALLWLLLWRGAVLRPGTLLGVFVAGYGVARFFVEFFRQADAQFISPENPLGHVLGSGAIGLSMGQVLSLPMILVGVWFVWRARRGA